MRTRAKFRCQFVIDHGFGSKEVSLTVVTGKGDEQLNPENANFTKFTPSGDIKMRIDNPAASVQFVPGKYYYADFTMADD